MEPVADRRHITTDQGICGGKPTIAGTRIRVWDIHVWHNLRGRSPEEIVASFPQLSVADIHAALAYYFDHREAIDAQMAEADAFAESVAAEHGPTKFSRIRDEVLAGKDGHDDSVSSG